MNQQGATTLWALPFGRLVTSPLEVLQELVVSGEGGSAAAGLQDLQHGIDVVLAEHQVL